MIASLSAAQATVQLSAPADGVVGEILAAVHTTVGADQPLVRVDGDGQNNTSAQPALRTAAPETTMATNDNVTPILMPQVGNSMEEGTILSWKVAEGDRIEQGQIIYEVETDKAAVEIEADHAGRLAKIVAQAGDIVPIKEPVAYLAENDADVEAMLAASSTATPTAEQKPAPAQEPQARGADEVRSAGSAAPAQQTATGRPKASPAARRVAAERGVDLGAVATGSGPGGRILSGDVPTNAAPVPTEVATPRESVAPQTPAGRETMTSMRKAIGKALQASKQTIPHFYIEATVDAAAMMDFYRLHKEYYKCSVNDVILLACGRAIGEFASFRSRIDGDELVTTASANIGVAVGTDDGLVVPVVLGVESMTLRQAAEGARAAVEAARAGKLQNVGKGVFTISNLGMFGIDRFSAIINPPEAAILAVGAVREEAVVAGGVVKPGKVCTLTLSCDHRVIDGVEAAKFLARLRELLENPGLLA